MHVAMLCTGPTLPKIGEYRGRIDAKIGVNRAACHWPCDWWCFGDFVVGMNHKPLGMPRWFLDRSAAKYMIKHRPGSVPVNAVQWHHANQSNPRGQAPDGWYRYSCHAALLLALGLGCDRVTAFGVDWEGTAEWDGSQPEKPHEARSPRRWEVERALWDDIVEWSGVKVVRYGYDKD